MPTDSVLTGVITEVYCAVGDEHWTIADFQQHIVSGFAEAIAQACVLAIAVNPPAICVAATAVGTAVV